MFRSELPRMVVHCAAMSRSQDCQSRPEAARRANLEVTVHLAELASAIPFIFFSTDLIFDGCRGNYEESALANPRSVYGETKAEAEAAVRRNPLHTIIRTSLNSGPSPSGDRGFDEQMVRAWERGEVLRLFTDEFRSPIAAEATARAVWELAQQGCSGVFHVAGSESLSRYRIGELLAAKYAELKPKFAGASVAEWKGAPRAPNTTLNCAKAQGRLSFTLPRWSEWLASSLRASA